MGNVELEPFGKKGVIRDIAGIAGKSATGNMSVGRRSRWSRLGMGIPKMKRVKIPRKRTRYASGDPSSGFRQLLGDLQ